MKTISHNPQEKSWLTGISLQVKNNLLLVLVAALFTGCALNLVTGRNKLSLINE